MIGNANASYEKAGFILFMHGITINHSGARYKHKIQSEMEVAPLYIDLISWFNY